MKKIYSAPVMYREAYVMDQYIAASDCGTKAVFPDHGHVNIKDGQIHCAFTSSNCGVNAKAGSCCLNLTETSAHQEITRENGTVITSPTSGHNCHILSTKEAARSFADTYRDKDCGDGVAALMGLQDFDEMKTAFS